MSSSETAPETPVAGLNDPRAVGGANLPAVSGANLQTDRTALSPSEFVAEAAAVS
jgi:hypothetical protein